MSLVFQNALAGMRLDPLVQTKVGLIRGLRASDGDYSMFMGVPYAKLNETNPFGPSLPHPEFAAEFKAYDDTVECPHIDTDNNNYIGGSLDCLRLNIYVPHSATSTNRLPVMVYIHGGNFERGSASRALYGPKYLVRHDVILVTINHRVGLYGFMCLHNMDVPGNQGLKDQIAALRWIKDNIESFGGDANKVTIFGNSSGGRSIDFLVFSPQEPLFNNAILQSGTSLTRDTIYEADTEVPLKLADKLGFKTESLNAALTFLATVEPTLVVATANELQLVVKPCVEKALDGIENVITDYTINLDIPKAKTLNFLIGHNEQEQVARYADKKPEFFDDLNIIYDRLSDYFDFDEEYLSEMAELVHKFYLGDDTISVDTMWPIIQFDSTFSYVVSTQRSIQMYMENKAKAVYYYVFSYNGGRNYYKDLRNVTVGGASHADELGYLFDMQSRYTGDASPEDQLIIDRITTLWTNFAKFGNPTPEETDLLPVKWLPVHEDYQHFYNLDTEIHLGKRPYHMETAFWELFYKINWKLQKGFKENKL
ncbi:carboxylesterase family domain-containing protein [Phthorimaea operculella]|nr:carboxylesterase family domain-containing protein [Phthorimaea operculella]